MDVEGAGGFGHATDFGRDVDVERTTNVDRTADVDWVADAGRTADSGGESGGLCREVCREETLGNGERGPVSALGTLLDVLGRGDSSGT